MSKLARELLEARAVVTRDGRSIPLHSETTVAQCEFLTGLIRDIDAKVCLEVGLAFGISSLFICDEIAKKPGATFISIDPFNWHDYIGLYNLERAGFKDLVRFHGDYSGNVLPKLLEGGGGTTRFRLRGLDQGLRYSSCGRSLLDEDAQGWRDHRVR